MARPLARLFLAIGALLAAFAAVPAGAQAGIAGTPLTPCIARAEPGFDVHRALGAARHFDCSGQQTRLGRGDFWVRAAVPAGAAPVGLPQHVRFASVWLDSLTLYARYADGAVVRIDADDRAMARAIQLGAIVDLAVPARNARLDTLA